MTQTIESGLTQINTALIEDEVAVEAEVEPQKVLCEKIADDFYILTTDTKEAGRKLAKEIAHAEAQLRLGDNYQASAVDAVLQRLEELEIADDYRLDGNQLTYSEEFDEVASKWSISVIMRNASAISTDHLRRTLQQVGVVAKGDESSEN